jgi:LmbE family N-acetylglucosaminyl deacetylase
MSVLVVTAHPDDEVLGCGGTMARAAAAGEDVHVLILGEGSTSRSDDRAEADAGPVEALRADAERAGAVLGVTGVEVLDLPDNRFDRVDLLDIVKRIEARIDEHRPTIVYTQHGGDVNVDHRRTFEAVLAATRPAPGQVVEQVLAYEVASSTEWAFQTLAPSFRARVFVDITATLDLKLAAMACYRAELRGFPHPRSPESLRAQATRWGTAVGVAAAEAFDPVRIVRRERR